MLRLPPARLAQTTLNGAGATFPYPIYSKWFSEYHNQHSDIQVNYQSIGSGGGIRQVQAGTVDFGATDGPMTDEQIAASKVKVLHVPTVLGAVVPAYNIPGVTEEVKFTPDILAGIFLGKITNWNDPAIAKANPGHQVPQPEHHGGASLRWQRHHLHLHRLPFEDQLRLAGHDRQGNFGEVAGRRGRQGQRRRGGHDSPASRFDWLHRTDLRAAEQDHLRQRQELVRAISSRPAWRAPRLRRLA